MVDTSVQPTEREKNAPRRLFRMLALQSAIAALIILAGAPTALASTLNASPILSWPATDSIIPRTQRSQSGFVYEIFYVGYPISIGYGITLRLGHAGILAIDPEGGTRYFEYGRYQTNFGQVRRRRIPDVKIGGDGRPTRDSLFRLYSYLSRVCGKDSPVRAIYYPDANYRKVIWFATLRMWDPNRRAYTWDPIDPNDCWSFAAEAAAAGIDYPAQIDGARLGVLAGHEFAGRDLRNSSVSARAANSSAPPAPDHEYLRSVASVYAARSPPRCIRGCSTGASAGFRARGSRC